MKIKKILAGVLSLSLCAAILSGCGASDSGNSGKSNGKVDESALASEILEQLVATNATTEAETTAAEAETTTAEESELPDEFVRSSNDNDFMYDLYERHAEVTGYIGNGGNVVFPAEFEGLPVTKIGSGKESVTGFILNKSSSKPDNSITNITIPEGVTTLGFGAFMNCEALVSVSLPSTLKHLEGYQGSNETHTFYGCINLTEITIQDGLEMIGGMMFEECSSLKNITIPSSVTNIGTKAFFKSGVESVAVPDSVTEYGEWAFADCANLKEITLSANAKVLPRGLCQGAPITKVSIPDGVERIESEVFYYCWLLTEVEIPASVTYIDCGNALFEHAFGNTPWLLDDNTPKAINGIRIK